MSVKVRMALLVMNMIKLTRVKATVPTLALNLAKLTMVTTKAATAAVLEQGQQTRPWSQLKRATRSPTGSPGLSQAQ